MALNFPLNSHRHLQPLQTLFALTMLGTKSLVLVLTNPQLSQVQLAFICLHLSGHASTRWLLFVVAVVGILVSTPVSCGGR